MKINRGRAVSIPEYGQVASWAAPACWRQQLTERQWQWMNDETSLTERLERCAGQLHVDVLAEQWHCQHDNSHGEGSELPARDWCREVLLCGDDQPWVYACTRIPETMLSQTGLDRLGTRPIGHLLFGRPGFTRGAFEFALLTTEQMPRRLTGRLDLPARLWARRSPFVWQGQTLTITEIFLPQAPMHSAEEHRVPSQHKKHEHQQDIQGVV